MKITTYKEGRTDYDIPLFEQQVFFLSVIVICLISAIFFYNVVYVVHTPPEIRLKFYEAEHNAH